MDNYDKIQQLYESGRYQCDLYFYQELLTIATHLDLFKYRVEISANLKKTQSIASLTQKHLYVLQDEENEEGALKIIQQINDIVRSIEADSTHQIMGLIKTMNGKSYKQHIIAAIKKQPYKKPYLQICERLINSVHDPIILLNDLSTLCMFMHKNQDKITQFISIYQIVLTNGIEELKKFRANCQFINQNKQLLQNNQKTKDYLYGSYVLLHSLLRFNEIYKLLNGNNKFGLKIGTLKPQIEIENKSNPQIQARPVNVKLFRESLIGLNSTKMPQICNLCLREPGDHLQCINIIKMLYKPQSVNE